MSLTVDNERYLPRSAIYNALRLGSSPDIEREIRFGIFKYQGATSKLSPSNFSNLRQTLLEANMKTEKTVSVSRTWESGYRFESGQYMLKTREYIFRNEMYGFNFVISRETDVTAEEVARKVNIKQPDLIRNKIRYSFFPDDSGQYRLDLTEVTEKWLNTNKPSYRYEVELELLTVPTLNISSASGASTAASATAIDTVYLDFITTINGYIEFISKAMYSTQMVFPAQEKFEAFATINKVLKSEYVAALDNNKLPKVVNLKPDHLSSTSRGLFPLTHQIRCQASIKIDGKRKFLWLGPKWCYLVAPYDSFNKLYIDLRNYALPQHLYFTLFEGEYIDNIFFAYDTIIYGGNYYLNKDHQTRLSAIKEFNRYSGIFLNLTVVLKKFYPFTNAPMMFDVMRKLLNDSYDFKTDGVIISQNSAANSLVSYKWKPAENLTIDFLYSGKRLYVGNKILFARFPYQVELPVNDNSIVELSFEKDAEDETHPVFIRLRNDKPAPNSADVANDVWDDIERPIPELGLKGQQFYALFRHHNRVKDDIYSRIAVAAPAAALGAGAAEAKPQKSILVVGAGKGGDLGKQAKYGFTTIVNVEPNPVNLALLKQRLKAFPEISATNLMLRGQQVREILTASPVKKFDCLVYMLSLSFFFDDMNSVRSIISLAKNSLKTGGYFACLTIDGDKVRAAMNTVSGHFLGDTLNIDQVLFKVLSDNKVYIDIPSSRTVHDQTEYLTRPQELAKFLKSNGFKSVVTTGDIADVPADLGLNSQEAIFNSLYSYMIFQKL